MKNYFFVGITVCLLGLFFASFTAEKSDQGELSKDKKFLFNGKDLKGWHTFNKESADDCWIVEDGAIKLDHQYEGGGDLVTDDAYEDYILEMDWKISRAGNSGIIFNVQEGEEYNATYLTGLEMQVLDNEEASDNKQDDHLAGSLYDLIPCDPKYVSPVGEWNKVKIKQKKGKVTFWMNDHKVLDFKIGSKKWDELVENSKFGKEPFKGLFGAFTKGHIALQDHGHSVWYKNITITEL